MPPDHNALSPKLAASRSNIRVAEVTNSLITRLRCEQVKTNLTLEEASERLAISHKVVPRLIESKAIPAAQNVPWTPWEIPVESIESEDVLRQVRSLKRRVRSIPALAETQPPMFAEF